MDNLDFLADLIARARAAGADAADAVLIPAPPSRWPAGWARQSMSSAPKAATWACACSWASGRPSCHPPPSIPPASLNWPSVRSPWHASCRKTRSPAWPTPPHRRGTWHWTWKTRRAGPRALIARAAAAEEAALAVPGVTNSEGAEAGFGRTEAVVVTSAGFAGRQVRTSHSVSAAALAGTGTAMQRDYDYHSTVHLADLDDPVEIGRSAGERAVTRLNPMRPKTAKVPVIYDPRVAGSLLGHLAGAINGAGVARGTSFLKDRLGQRIFAAGIEVHDDPLRVRGLRSRLFDGEGTPTARAT